MESYIWFFQVWLAEIHGEEATGRNNYRSMYSYFWRNKGGIFLRICQRQHLLQRRKSWRIDKGRIEYFQIYD